MEQGAHALSLQNRGSREGQSDKILFGLTASSEVVIKSWKPRIIPSPFGDCVVTAGKDQRASLRSFRIAIIIRLWATVLRVDNGVCMVNKPMI